MFKNRRFLLLLLALMVFLSCQPFMVKKPVPKKENIDSLLFYQKEDVPDPFLDGLLTVQDQPVTIHKTIYPEITKPKFKEIDGFRVQVFATVDSLNAIPVLSQLKAMVHEKVYLLHHKNLFKVQVGDFPYRQPADSLRQFLKRNGFPGAWTVQTKIKIPIQNNRQIPTASQKNVEFSPELHDFFQIQVFATSNKSKAQSIVDDLRQRFKFPCNFSYQNNLFKIFLGKFSDRQQAETVLKRIKDLGFKDAWIVHKP